jgi:hypothetical protein
MQYIQIRNYGEIEEEGFKLLGASTKRENESKIGFFGSGIKYTIAYLLRNNLFFKVYAGTNRINFDIKETTLRGQSFQKVLVNGEETSIATSWGEHWTRWMIFREIVTNAFDEDNFYIALTNEINPVPDRTTFYLKYEDFKEYYDNLSNYFRPELITETEESVILKDHPSPLNVFKKGIRVIEDKGYGRDNIISLFDYNIPCIDLNEERIASMWEVKWCVTKILTNLKDQKALQLIYDAILDNRRDIFEVQEVFSNIAEYHTLSTEWLDVLNKSEAKVLPDGHKEFIVEEKGDEYIEDNKIRFIPTPFADSVKRSFGDEFKGTFKSAEVDEDFILVEKTLSQQSSINEGLNLLMGKGIKLEIPIEVAIFKSKDVKTLVKNETLYICKDSLDDRLITTCVSLLIEGYIKNRYNVKDGTKEMQSACIELLAGFVVD